MESLIKVPPAAFPPHNTPEMNSVIKLQDLLDKKLVKPDLKFMDKWPNIDGYLAVVDESETQIGKLEVQIKTLPDDHIQKPKYQCPLSFLSYCEKSGGLPVLLIIVNNKHEIAFWLHIDSKFIKEIAPRISGDSNSISISFPSANIIQRDTTKYVKDWIAICQQHRHKVLDYCHLEDKHRKLQEIHDNLIACMKRSYTIGSNDIAKLQLFITTYNGLLSGALNIVKNIYYNGFNKIGIGYSKYENERLSYFLFPVRINEPIELVKEIHTEELFEGDFFSLQGHNTKNPIKENPIKYAWEVLIKDALEIINEQRLKFVNRELASEFLATYIDKILFICKINIKTTYNLTTFLNRLSVLYVLWCEEIMERPTLGTTLIFNIKNLSEQLATTRNAKRHLKKAIIKYRRGVKPSFQVEITSDEDFDCNYLEAALYYFRSRGQHNVTRIYTAYEFNDKRKGIRFVWTNISASDLAKKIEVTYNLMPKLVNQYVEEFFPEIKTKITFFDDFDKLIVNINHSGRTGLKNRSWIEMYYLKAEEIVPKSIDVYVNGLNCPVIWKTYFSNKNKIKTQNECYKIVGVGLQNQHKVFSALPLQELMQSVVAGLIGKFFKKKLEEL